MKIILTSIATILFTALTLAPAKDGERGISNGLEAAPNVAPRGKLPFSVQKFDSVKEIEYPWGWIRWVMNAELDPGATQTLGIVEILPGQRNPLHKHPNCEEVLYLLSGTLEHVVGNERVVLHAGDVLRVPVGVPHQGINTGKVPARAVVSYDSGTRQMVALEEKKE
jgi:mannose-6-phosphate isomerase-like protein (cupin superfamily)